MLLVVSESGAGRIARWHTRKCIFQQKCQEIGKEEKAINDCSRLQKCRLSHLSTHRNPKRSS